ncbi:MAG: hypothetical protein RLY35_43 [Bacteroidota bacterium]|jgi:hypothetical protein
MSSLDEMGYDGASMEFIVISSSEMEVRLAWLLNTHLKLDLCRIDDIKVPQRDKEFSYHTRFIFNSDEEKMEVNLFENKSPNGPLIPDWARWDYILKLDHEREPIAPLWVPKIKTIPGVAAALEIELTKIKTLERLIQACFPQTDRR